MQRDIIITAASVGAGKAGRTLGRLFILSVLAGAFVSLGGALSVMLGQGVSPDAGPGVQKLLSALAFPVGLFLIVSFGADLFTGNNALLIPALNDHHISKTDVVKNWTLVWIGNFIGALLFTVLFVTLSGIFDNEPYHSAVCNIAQTKVTLPTYAIFLRGIGANWCVCLAVWLALGAKTLGAKALACWIPVAAFVALGYEHCIANMFFIPCGMLAGADVTVGQLFLNLALSTAGNIVGGALMVGQLFHRLYGRQ